VPAPRHLLDLTPDELAAWFEALGEPAYRAEQVLTWVYRHLQADFHEMTVLPRALRDRLAEEFTVLAAAEVERLESTDGATKILLRWPDGASTETVMIPAVDDGPAARRTACLSTQVGCGVGCRFCASGLDGVLRDLTVGEVIEQAWRIAHRLSERGERLSHVVYMGMGEPLANYATTVESVRRLNAEWNLHIAQRRITISTVGLPKQIERLAEEGLQTTLALSLHAADDALRGELIPWARGVDLQRLMPALQTYFRHTGREVTFEYCLLAGVNDRQEDAAAVASLARRLRADVNLLMYNPVEGLPYRRPSRNRAIRFLHTLRQRGVSTHLRESRGLESAAACGQLRRRRELVASGP
jgi:23S rRNA (adenine2503-C2)-methyltransferase